MTGMKPNTAAEAEIHMRADLQSAIRQAATRLQSMSEAVSQIADELDNAPVGQYASYVARVQHEVLWGLANLSIDRLTREAGNLDMAHQMALAPDLDALADSLLERRDSDRFRGNEPHRMGERLALEDAARMVRAAGERTQ